MNGPTVSSFRRKIAVLLFVCMGILGKGTALHAQRQVLVHVLNPAFSSKGDTLIFGIGVYVPVNLNQVLAGTALGLEFTELSAGDGLQLHYVVRSASETIRNGSVSFSNRNNVRVPLERWDGKGKLIVQVSAQGSGWQDVTSQVNNIPRGHRFPYGYAEIERVKIKKAQLGYLTSIGRWLMSSFHKGGVISYILLLLFVWGVVVSIFHLVRLFLSPRWSVRRIKEWEPDSEEKKVAGAVRSGANVGAMVSDVVSKRMRKIEVALSTGMIGLNEVRSLESASVSLAENLVIDLVGLEINDLSIPRRLKKIVEFFPLSLESLWNAAVLAPLLGLLGTVVGISSAFQGVRFVSAMKDPGAAMSYLSEGINKALYTTVHGLIVGIFLMVSFYLCTRRARAVQQAAKEIAEKVVREYLVRMARQHVRVVE